ncbi:MAG: YicC/YloC family endoribonuclease [Terriglobia bacterium]
MIRSMTGYGEGQASEGPFAIAATLKSVNHRFLDVQMRLSAGLEFFEPRARRILKEALMRGHVEAAVSLERVGPGALRLDHPLLKSYLDACREIRRDYELSAEPDLVALLRIPGVVTSANGFTGEEKSRLGRMAEKALGEAIQRLNESRSEEGAALDCDLRGRLNTLDQQGGMVRELSGSMLPAFRARIEKRLRELALEQPMEPSRIAQEAAALALRADIDEEITRFRMHVQQAVRLLEAGGEVGKKLDFLLQEMNREANTMLSKTTDLPGVGARIADCAMKMKAEVEKIREQAQNIE